MVVTISCSVPSAGAVYVFSRSGQSWNQQAYIKASNPGENDFFGWSVALSGDGATLAVGSYLEDSSAAGINGNQQDNAASNAGAVYMFSRADIVWSQTAYVKASNTETDDSFGYSVAVSADASTLVVGAIGEDSAAINVDGDPQNNSSPGSGTVYVYQADNTRSPSGAI